MTWATAPQAEAFDHAARVTIGALYAPRARVACDDVSDARDGDDAVVGGVSIDAAHCAALCVTASGRAPIQVRVLKGGTTSSNGTNIASSQLRVTVKNTREVV